MKRPKMTLCAMAILSLSIFAAGCMDVERIPNQDPPVTVSRTSLERSIHAQSTTGPTPPRAVILRDLAKQAEPKIAGGGAADEVIIDNVPSYEWRHGCGPTALGMVVGYYDNMGYDLIDGDAAFQTDAVNQAIASGGDDESSAFPAGREAHFENYSLPIDGSNIMDDAYLSDGRTPHADNCIADYMDTSKSSEDNAYGWSWSHDIVPAFEEYVAKVAPQLEATGTQIINLSWGVFTSEMDNDRPMVFLVDTDSNGDTDHFVTVIGYRETPTRQYACRDTWSDTIRWEDFADIANGQPWGIWAGYTFRLGDADSCSDSIFNGDETDMDCGGSCAPCADHLSCMVDADCESHHCVDDICTPQTDGTPIPGRVEAEYYSSEHDTTMGNEGDRDCDWTGNVDAEVTSDIGGGCNVGWTAAGEWMTYEIYVEETDTFDITARLASQYTGRSLHVEIDDVDVTGSLTAPSNGWQSFENRTREGVVIEAGTHIVRVFMETDYINVNYIDFTLSAGGPTCDDGIQNQGEEGIDCGGPCEACQQVEGCTCSSGCDAVVDATAAFVKDGSDNTCYFFSGSAGNYINSWNMTEVNINGLDVTNKWISSQDYPALSDGGYYLYVYSTVPWGHIQVSN